MRLKPEEIKYDYCWHCLVNYAICPECGANSCGVCCPIQTSITSYDQLPCHKNGFWEVTDEAIYLGYIPKEAQPEAVNNWLKFILDKYPNYTEEEKLAGKIFGKSVLDEENYYYVKKAADLHGIVIPSLEEISKTVNEKPNYNCKTGYDWQQETLEIKIIEINGWINEESFNNEKIPWLEFCKRRKQSITDDTEYNNKYGRKNRKSNF